MKTPRGADRALLLAYAIVALVVSVWLHTLMRALAQRP